MANLRPVLQNTNHFPLVFQLLDVQVRDKIPPHPIDDLDPHSNSTYEHLASPGDDDEGDSGDREPPKCTVFVFGVTQEGTSVTLLVEGFCPWLYVELGPKGGDLDARTLVRLLTQRLRLPHGVLSHELEWKHRLYGWIPETCAASQQVRKFPFVKIMFPNTSLMYKAQYALKSLGGRESLPDILDVSELKVHASQKFMQQAGLRASSWVQCDSGVCVEPNKRLCTTQLEIKCSSLHVLHAREDLDLIAPLVIASVDAEMYSPTDEFPHALCTSSECLNSNCQGGPIIYLGTHFWVYGDSEPRLKVMQCLGSVDTTLVRPDIVVLCYDSELQLLEAWRDLISDTDILTGYNVMGFDFRYMSDRVNRLRVRGEYSRFLHTGRIAADVCTLKERDVDSAAFGQNSQATFPMTGRIVFDLMFNLKNSVKLSSYSLDNLAKVYLSDTSTGPTGNGTARVHSKEVLDSPGWICSTLQAVREAIVQGIGSIPSTSVMSTALSAALQHIHTALTLQAQRGRVFESDEHVQDELQGEPEEEEVELDLSGNTTSALQELSSSTSISKSSKPEKSIVEHVTAAQQLLNDAGHVLISAHPDDTEELAMVQVIMTLLKKAAVASGTDNYRKLFALYRL